MFGRADSWKREGIQFNEDEKKNGSMSYLEMTVVGPTELYKIDNILSTKHLQGRTRHILDEKGSHSYIWTLLQMFHVK